MTLCIAYTTTVPSLTGVKIAPLCRADLSHNKFA